MDSNMVSVTITKEVLIKEGLMKMENKLQFIDSARFMASSLSNLVVNLDEVIHKIKCKYGMILANVKLAKLNTIIEGPALNTQTLKMI